ncbi:MAG: hypothetical protein HZB99_01960 [Candidatus Harrisonbacteria bacterium]|nr:hypothetical protein [Candidatus Harrisonbacteria bacterium]
MHLVIVQHFKPEFESETAEFFEYFRNQVKLPLDRIHFYNEEVYKKKVSLEDFLKDIAKINEPVVLYYGGHGYRDGWQLLENRLMSYRSLIQILRNRSKPAIFVNDCCFGMALKDHICGLQCRYLLLGLAPKTCEGEGSVVPGIIRCWKERRLADPRLWVMDKDKRTPFILEKYIDLLRCGDQLDNFCYPKK